MRICIISDTHNKHKQIEHLELLHGDVIIHCGDFTSMGYIHEITNFFKWFSNLNQFEHKICIAGNHDLLFEDNPALAKSLIPSNVIYLQDSEVIINNVKFYGTPHQKIFYNWAFNKKNEDLLKYWNMIPDDVDVLITHTPPYKILDNVGNRCEGDIALRVEILERIKPKINCFGHIHESHGITEVNNIKFINASILNDKYIKAYDPIIIEI